MKNGIILLAAAALLQGCASLAVVQRNGMENPAAAGSPQRQSRAGTSISDGGHAVVMSPCGNTSVVVNPDGTHSIAIVNGSTATIVTP